ncbi:serine/threonine-protein kinase [Nonomuraea montanisoli]|uniref:serine/threonine-protein kinase n=1 Tax=Nonomuraea montanisoli TaxID=2741721 RepID=UPI002E28F24F|nr:protein kinase [Nonomuraea montanisoli]
MVLHAMNDDRLGPYRLLRRLGEGGMGVVHLAADPQGRHVAVKVLRGEVAGDEVARRRLSREVETMRRVRSRYIAEVVDADVTGHRPYIVTRYVPGRSLDEIVKDDGPLDLPAVVRIAHGVATALSAVHSVGVIHRDLKPGNVLILDGEPVLIDFGIAQAVDATRLTQTGMFIGTPGYLAPEIIEGQEAGPEVDVHAWAGTLLYACTGQPPFGKGTLEMIFYNITAGKAEIGAAPAELQPLLKAAFQRNPGKRPKAAELAEQTARMLPRSPGGSPDEISTVPGPDRFDLPAPRPVAERPAWEISTPPVTPRQLLDGQEVRFGQPGVPAPGQTPPGQDQPYVSLLGQGGPAVPGAGQGGPVVPGAGQGGPVVPGAGPGGSGTGQGTGQSGPVAGAPGAGQAGPTPGGDQSDPWASDEGDPWPTRRVTPEELRRMQQESGAQPWQGAPRPGDGPAYPRPGDNAFSRPGDSAASPWPGEGSASPWPQEHGPLPSQEGDVPTRRVRPDSPDYGRPNVDYGRPGPAPGTGPNAGPAPYPGSGPHAAAHPGSGPHGGPAAFSGPAAYSGPHATPASGPQAGHQAGQQAGQQAGHQSGHAFGMGGPAGPGSQGRPTQQPPPPYIPAQPHYPPDPRTKREPFVPGAVPGQVLQRSRAYGVAGAMLLVVMIVVAVMAPVLVAAVVVPVAVLLRAADLAQPELIARRSTGAAALDVVRVFAHPQALAKSVGITLALVLYALILGLPVTLLLTVVLGTDPYNALAWGASVALWTLCAGPGVEGPGRQMRRTLASLVPSRTAAMVLAGVLGAAAALSLLLAYGTFRDDARRAVWAPVDVGPVVEQLDGLKGDSGG